MQRALVILAFVLLVCGTPATAGAAWSRYFGPSGTMYCCGGTPNSASSGFAYWTTNRVWRPVNLPYLFRLGYVVNGVNHFSASNGVDNPFTWPAYGYNYLYCTYVGTYFSVYPVTCEGFQ